MKIIDNDDGDFGNKEIDDIDVENNDDDGKNLIQGSLTGSSGGSLIALHLDAFSRLYLNMGLIRTKMMSMMKSVTIINFWMLFVGCLSSIWIFLDFSLFSQFKCNF